MTESEVRLELGTLKAILDRVDSRTESISTRTHGLTNQLTGVAMQMDQVLTRLADHETRIRSVENMTRTLGDELKSIAVDGADREQRVRWLERWMWALPASALAAVASAGVALVIAIR